MNSGISNLELWKLFFPLCQSGGKNKPAVPIPGLTFPIFSCGGSWAKAHTVTEKVTVPLRAWLILLLIPRCYRGQGFLEKLDLCLLSGKVGDFHSLYLQVSEVMCGLEFILHCFVSMAGAFFDSCKRILRWKELNVKIAFFCRAGDSYIIYRNLDCTICL